MERRPFFNQPGFFSGLLLFGNLSGYQVSVYIWNALALNIFAWVTSRLPFSFQLQTFVGQKELEQARAKSDELLLNILFTSRGSIQVKGIGQMNMYFLR